MASRFVETDEEFIEELRNTSVNKNTKRSTVYWTNIFQQWGNFRQKWTYIRPLFLRVSDYLCFVESIIVAR